MTDEEFQEREACLADELRSMKEAEANGWVDPQVAENVRLKLLFFAKGGDVDGAAEREPSGPGESLRISVRGASRGGRIVSRFLALEALDPKAAERCAAAASDEASAPPFPVAGCELVADQVFSLGEAFVRTTGAVEFAHLGSVSLVAMPDPSNRRLRERIKGVVGECRFFRSRAESLQALIDHAVDERAKGVAS